MTEPRELRDTHPVQFTGILFDLDGTLLDTVADLGESMNAVLRGMKLPEHPLEAYQYFAGDGAALLVSRALPETHRDPATIASALDGYRRAYASRWNIHSRPYPGIPELLDATTKADIRLGILSNKPHDFTLLCQRGFLSKWPFLAILGQRESVPKKPDPAGALEAATLLNCPPDKVLYMGDTATDMETANAAGMFSLGVTWGFRKREELLAAGARAIIDHPLTALEILGI